MNPYVVMLVDDEEAFVQTMAKRLAKRGMKIIPAFSGNAALEKLNQEVDVVILDVKMPGLDGLETLQRIKGQQPLVEVIMLTGHATVESAIDGMKLGAFDYLMKPCDIETLDAKINEAGRRKRELDTKISEARAQMIAMRRGD